MTINRRDFIVGGLTAVTSGNSLRNRPAESDPETQTLETLHISTQDGMDSNPGMKQNPLKTLAEAANRVNASRAKGPTTIILSEGVYILDKTVLFKNDRPYTKTERLTIRAEVLPDDPDWAPDRMPVIVSAMPLERIWLAGRPDQFGENCNGLQIEVSHATVQGLKILGRPVYEYLAPEKIRRNYPIMREGMDLDDLLVTQCLFVGDPHTVPNHVSVIANGHGLVVDHSVFYNCKIPAVFWLATGGTSIGNAMRNCLVYGAYGCGVWTCQTGEDFQFHHNILANGLYAWIRQNGSKQNYRVTDSLFADNRFMAGFGAGPLLHFKTTDSDFMKIGEGVVVTGKAVQVEQDQSKRYYLHVVPGTLGAELGAGLFQSSPKA